MSFLAGGRRAAEREGIEFVGEGGVTRRTLERESRRQVEDLGALDRALAVRRRERAASPR